MSEFKPGTVAVATVRGVPNVRAFRLRERTWVTGQEIQRTRLHHDEDVTDVRPLVVLDLVQIDEDAEAFTWAEVADHLRDCNSITAVCIADQITRQTKPPKPPEPTGLGAVVEDAEGVQWVRTHGVAGTFVWQHDLHAPRAIYSRIDAVRVLSEGVAQ